MKLFFLGMVAGISLLVSCSDDDPADDNASGSGAATGAGAASGTGAAGGGGAGATGGAGGSGEGGAGGGGAPAGGAGGIADGGAGGGGGTGHGGEGGGHNAQAACDAIEAQNPGCWNAQVEIECVECFTHCAGPCAILESCPLQFSCN